MTHPHQQDGFMLALLADTEATARHHEEPARR